MTERWRRAQDHPRVRGEQAVRAETEDGYQDHLARITPRVRGERDHGQRGGVVAPGIAPRVRGEQAIA